MVEEVESVAGDGRATLIYEFNNVRPIELLDFTGSLLALGEQYKNFVRREGAFWWGDDFRLYVKQVRSGSIIAELVSYSTQGQLIGPLVPFIIPFVDYIGTVFDFLKGVKEAKDIGEMLIGLTKKDYQQLAQIIEPVAKDSGSQINFIAKDGGSIVLNVALNSNDANAVQNRIRQYTDEIPESLTGVHRDEVLYWYQVRADSASKPGDKAVIERFSSKPVRVRFYSEEVKRTMINTDDNPFRKLYVVDVDVTVVDQRPVLYKVLDVKEVFDRDE